MLETGSFTKAVRIALPVAMQGMLNTIVNLVDTMMIGTLGKRPSRRPDKVFLYFHSLYSGSSAGAESRRPSAGAIMM
ncbi:MAG: hypothetical protein ACLU8D_09340 [Enterocloster sp.]